MSFKDFALNVLYNMHALNLFFCCFVASPTHVLRDMGNANVDESNWSRPFSFDSLASLLSLKSSAINFECWLEGDALLGLRTLLKRLIVSGP